MDLIELATTLFSNRRTELGNVIDSSVEMLSATAAVDSDSGNVGVYLDADITTADDTDGDESIIDMPTSPAVKDGDDLLIGLVGSGTMRTPVVLANYGSGDRLQSQMDITEELVERAEEAARATSQHFWHDDNGAHVTQVTQDEWNDSTGSDYHSGPNSLWNALGVLFRDGLTNLLAVLTNGIAIYDGEGNTAANVLAEFTANLVRIGGRFATTGQSSAGVQFFADDSSTSDLTASHYIDTTQDMQVYHNLMLDGTTTDQMLTGGTVTHSASGNLATYQEVYNDGTNWSEESDTGITAKTGDAQQVAKMGVNTLRSSAGTQTRRAYVQADTLRLTHGTGSGASVSDVPMQQVIDVLNGSEDGTFTRGANCNDYNRASVWRQGHMGGLSIVLQTTSNTTRTWSEIGTISIHPKAEVRALCGNETGAFSIVNITTAGRITILQSATGSMWSQINCVFPT